MSYETRYHPHLCKNLPLHGKQKGSFRLVKWMILLAILVLGVCFRNNGLWKEFMIPGDPAVTSKAVETLAKNLKEGTPLDSALMDFCTELAGND